MATIKRENLIFASHTGLVRSPRVNDGMTLLHGRHRVRLAPLFDMNGLYLHG